MKTVFWFGTILTAVCWCSSQSSTMVVNVVEISSALLDYTFVCDISPATTLTRWTYLTGSTETLLMRFQNGTCTASPSNSFLSDSKRFSYTCNKTVYQVTIHPYTGGSWNNHILACRDVLQQDRTESSWMIKIVQDGGTCSYCEPTITFDVMDVNEGNNVTFVCRVSSDVPYVNWNKNIGSNTAPVGVESGHCTTPNGTSYLDNTTEYIYTCNKTVYQVTRLKVQRSEHNDIYMCTTPSAQGGNWIIKVRAPVTSVTISSANSLVNVTEHTAVEFTCTTSTSRPAASVYWYTHPNGNSNNITQITENIIAATDYKDLSVINSILRFVLTRLHNNMKIFCTANNSINANPMNSNEILLDVQHKAYHPYIIQGNEYHVIGNTTGTLSCSAKGGNPVPKLSWKCENFSPTNISTNNSHGNVSTTLKWTASGNHSGICTCTSQQMGYQNESIDVSLVVLHKLKPPTGFRYIESRTTTSSIHLEWKPGSKNGPPQIFYIKFKKSSDTLWNYLKVPDNGEESMEYSLTELTANTQYEIVIFGSYGKGNSSESIVLVTTTKAIDKPNLISLIGGIAGGVAGCIVLVIVIIVLIRRYPVFKRSGADKQGVRRSISVDNEDGLQDNPMYESSNNVPSRTSTPSVVYAKPTKPNKPNATGTGDVTYAEVKKTNKKEPKRKIKNPPGKGKQQEVDVYENIATDNDPVKKGVTKHPHPEKPTTKESKIVNNKGLIYADLEFNDKQPGKKIVIKGDDSTTYDLVDFKKKAKPLPESDGDDEK